MKQTPVHEKHNEPLLRVLPLSALRVVEVGCSSGALAREYKRQVAPGCDYLGIEIDADYAELAKRHCDRTMVLDIEQGDDAFWAAQRDRDCWIFGDTLEHLRDPWEVLRRIRSVIPVHGNVAACLPNVQHWSLQVGLSCGDFRYQDSGLLDRTHLRWFTRQTLFEMFDQCGFEVETGQAVVLPDPRMDAFLELIGNVAAMAGADRRIAMEDARAFQYVLLARPK
jgi:SAM-dependent methyltransferase